MPRPNKINLRRLTPLLGLALVGLLLAGVFYPILARRDKAAVLRLTGRARIWNAAAKKWKPLHVNTIVPDNSWIETDKRTKMVVFYRGVEIRLGAKTRVKIRNLTNASKPARV